MAALVNSFPLERKQAVARGLSMLADRPDWLEAALQSEPLLEALRRHIPEVAAGDLRLVDCSITRLFLKDAGGRYLGACRLTVEGAPGLVNSDSSGWQTLDLRLTLAVPGLPLPGKAVEGAPQPFGSEGWVCRIPELQMLCEIQPPPPMMEGLQRLLDPVQACASLEQALSAGSTAYRDVRILSCQPQVLNVKPGSRATLLYRLEYPPEAAGRGWPAAIIAKAYLEEKGERAYAGMVALWRSPLGSSGTVWIAEPLAYDPGQRLLLQTSFEQAQSFEELFQSAVQSREREAVDRLRPSILGSARGLAELHQSGASADKLARLEDRLEHIAELLDRLLPVAPELSEGLRSLLEVLEGLTSEIPPDPSVPSHGSFDGDQILISGDRIGFIDFDSFCMAEPSLDVCHFYASLVDSGMKYIPENTLQDPAACQAALERFDALGEAFLSQYESQAPISRPRLQVWMALDYFRDALQYWTKPKPVGGQSLLPILEYHLRGMGILPD